MGTITNPGPLGETVNRIVDRIISFTFLDREEYGVLSPDNAMRQWGSTYLMACHRGIVGIPLSSHDPKGSNVER